MDPHVGPTKEGLLASPVCRRDAEAQKASVIPDTEEKLIGNSSSPNAPLWANLVTLTVFPGDLEVHKAYLGTHGEETKKQKKIQRKT